MITRLGKHRYLRIAGFAVGAVVVATGAVLVTASASGLNFGPRLLGSTVPDAAVETASINDKANPSAAACAAFMKHFAVDLKKSQAEINAAVQKAIGETLADEVKSGDLTQAQADVLKKKLANQTACALIAGAGNKPSHGERGHKGYPYMQQYLSAATAVLGLTDAQMKTNLASGQTLSQMAAAHQPPISEADFRTALIAKLQPQLDTAVKNNQMTASQEQQILNQLKTGPLPYWDKPPMHPKQPLPGATTSQS